METSEFVIWAAQVSTFTELNRLRNRYIFVAFHVKHSKKINMANTSDEKPEEYSEQILRDMLPSYYKRLFPHNPFYRWLSYNSSELNSRN